MGKKAILDGDLCTGHAAGFPPRKITATSLVTIDGKSVALHGDVYDLHTNNDAPPHSATIVSSLSGLSVDGKPIGLHGDEVSCGGTAVGTSKVTFS